MATEVVMPKLGLTMTEGTINKWLKQVGEEVKKGEPLLEVSTDKVVTEVEAPAPGVLAKIIVPEGETVEVAKVIAIITALGEELPDIPAPETETKSEPKAPKIQEFERTMIQAPPAKERIKASPKAKKLAREKGLDLSQIKGTGPGGRIVARDVENFTPPATGPLPPVTAGDESVELQGMRKVIAERMSKSFSEKPHVTLNSRVDVSALQKLRNKINEHLESKGIKVTFNDLLLKVTAAALAHHRDLNAIVEGNRLVKRGAVNLGLAVALDDGLVVPVIKNADRLPLADIASLTKELIEKARAGRLKPDELQGGTFTLTNLGMYGIENFTPIINPPEVAILGVGQILKVPVVEGEEIAIKPMMYLSLSFDHRVIDGAQAAVFLKTLKELIEEPRLIWLL
ncbi:MAG: dihydrolipoamide acetyltransferase family protein [Dethiobacteria bacterium]|jgi:pyruvate dehydrogenase E2 component (dihydrolipoamide acetyltransferase)